MRDCRSVMSVGAGDGSGGGMEVLRVRVRSRLDGRFLLGNVVEVLVRGTDGTACTIVGS